MIFGALSIWARIKRGRGRGLHDFLSRRYPERGAFSFASRVTGFSVVTTILVPHTIYLLRTSCGVLFFWISGVWGYQRGGYVMGKERLGTLFHHGVLHLRYLFARDGFCITWRMGKRVFGWHGQETAHSLAAPCRYWIGTGWEWLRRGG